MSQQPKNIIKTDMNPYKEVNKQKEPGIYHVYNSTGQKLRKILTKTSTNTKVEQHHRTEIKKMVQEVESRGLLRANTVFNGELDDYPSYDFQEAQFMMAKARSTFEQMPSQLRKKFENNPAKFMDFANNPQNAQEMVELGLAKTLDYKDHTGASTGVTEEIGQDGTPSGNVVEPSSPVQQ